MAVIMRGMVDVMLIVPHPDDEVFSCGGLFTRMSCAGKRMATVTLTRGGSGRTLGICAQADLPDLRERELRASLEVLGVQEVHIFDYPDFVPAPDRGIPANRGVAEVPVGEMLERLVPLLDTLKPEVLITFPPNGSNGHPDHVATHRFVMQALARSAHTPARRYYFAGERPYSGPARAGFLPPDEIRRRHLFATHYLEVGDALENKLRALGQHESQARSVMAFMRHFPRRLLVESFHRAVPDYPEREGPRTVRWL